MLDAIIGFSLKNRLIVLLFTFSIIAFGTYSLTVIPIGAVPDVTNNQVQVITTSRDLATQDVEQFITYPVELEMANLPGVKEIRSISKFGLSVVTIVFEDRLGTHLPRQLIAEKIKSASQNIPESFGTPEMGPISTGLGEIYQYILEVDPAYRNLYSTMDLRTIQDWIVKRQLSGIPGVVEVNTWGGFLKQYEVTINPRKLMAMQISTSEVYEALSSNNSVAGGGYIEKSEAAFFIRGEGLVKTVNDIENIVVTTRQGIPIYIKDLARVGYGHATRFGAISGNGEGEKVLGQVMMLKNANSNEVIEAVKQRVKEISPSLPDGISINPFLERSELIGRTTGTITENLVLGCLIVIFVVVLLLGNWRAGLVVASVIPLSLLFALSMMNVFGVDANLMSLGAIDFGIIIDGAVIIVEYTAYQLTKKGGVYHNLSPKGKADFINELTFGSASKMMHSAVFGQLIIIIVFIPILSLSEVEGKMFQPMALTFVFALIGAMLLCFTYVPVISSMFLRPGKSDEKNLSATIMKAIKNAYQPLLAGALRHKKIVIAIAITLLAGTTVVFIRLGGEFVPTLDEGDFVIQPVLPTGTSLSRTVEITTDIEKAIKRFHEVDQVVTRIGAAEVPTDPMSMEETDVIITLKDRESWSMTKDELADAIKKELVNEMPEYDYEFTQPIEMRFNELITGVRADLAIKIYGDDLSTLADKAAEIEKLIEGVHGASDITMEKVEGLPQMQVKYNRDQIARFGLNISDVNDVISMGFAGKVAGSVFEGERRFDLVVRFDSDFRRNINDLENAYVTTKSGVDVPLRQLAAISYSTGPAKISRDDTKRRVVVGVNVRGRDLESVVNDVRELIEENINLPAGYRITYGGQFENLQNARERLSYAVPVALLLIFIMLHFAFQSAKDALMVYSAIPMAAIGGVLFLWIRELPFSISAGVGFIALFGVAVLNGIVLISHFKNLKDKGYDRIDTLVMEGTLSRLRPVLLTASAAALGFLPMAVSTSSGAEVQRPLATVVIGGLITSTLLTLVILPVLYSLLDGKKLTLRIPLRAILLFAFVFPGILMAQDHPDQLAKLIRMAKENNAALQASEMAIEKEKVRKGLAFDLPKTGVYYEYDEANIAPNNEALGTWGISQELRFPTVYARRLKIQKQRIEVEKSRYAMAELLLEKQVSQTYHEIIGINAILSQYEFLDSLYNRFSEAAARRFDLGETDQLEQLTAAAKHQEVQLSLAQIRQELNTTYAYMKSLIQTDVIDAIEGDFSRLRLELPDTTLHPGREYFRQLKIFNEKQFMFQKGNWLPDIQLQYFRANNDGPDNQVLPGFHVGIAIPLFYGQQTAQVRSIQLEQQIINFESEQYDQQLFTALETSLGQLNQYQIALEQWDEQGKRLSQTLLNVGAKSYDSGEINFLEYILIIERATRLHVNFFQNQMGYNDTVIEIKYLMN